MEVEKEVLVKVGERSRPVSFRSFSNPPKERESLLVAIKDTYKDILKEDDEFLVKIKSERWNGEFVELDGDQVVGNNSILQLSVCSAQEMKQVTGKAQDYCQKVGKVSEQSAKVLKKLYPAFSSQSGTSRGKRKFDPNEECIVANEKRKKKATSVRLKPRTFCIVLLPKMTVYVPRGYTRSRLAKQGHVQKAAFRKNMNAEEVKHAIVSAFSAFELKKYIFLRCGQDNRLKVVDDNDLNGDDIFELAGQGSIYICLSDSREEEVVVSIDSDEDCKVVSSPQQGVTSQPLVDELAYSSVELPGTSSNDFGNGSSSKESLDEWRAIRIEQDEAFEESLENDKEKKRKCEEEQIRRKRVDSVRSDCAEFFQARCCGETVRVAFKFCCGRKVEHKFSHNSTIKDLYRYVFTQGIPPPFTLATSVPRMCLSLCNVGNDTISSKHLQNSLIMVEDSDEELDGFLDFLEISQEEPCDKESSGAENFKLVHELHKIERIEYVMTLDTRNGLLRSVSRCNVFEDVLKMYKEEPVLNEYPMDVEFKGEMAVDQGGVTRDMFSAFCEKCYSALFEGSTLLVPMLSPQTDTSVFPVVGCIISHAYLVSGFLPVRIALPCIIGILCGPGAHMSQSILCEAFLDYISATERSLFKDALSTHSSAFSPDVQEKLLSTLSRFGCRQMPTPSNLKTCLLQVAHFEFCCKPAAAISLMHSGIPPTHSEFWRTRSVQGVCSIYRTLAVSCSKVLDIIKLPDALNLAEERVSGYLVEMIGNMSSSHVQRFLRFTTGSSVLTVASLSVQFNRLSGLARRPIAHTCSCVLELPVCYTNYSDFHSEWMSVLNDPELCWMMDSI